MKNEFEIIHHPKISLLEFLLVDIFYRQPHLHFEVELAYVLRGHGLVRTMNQEFEIHQGQAIVFNSCQSHEILSQQSLELFIIQFSPSAFENALPQLRNIIFASQPFGLTPGSALLKYFRKAGMSYFQERDFETLRAYGYSALIICELLKVCPYTVLNESQQNKIVNLQERIQNISNYIQSHYTDKVSLEDVAQQEGLTRTYFSHFFKKNFGITFKEYVDNLRCERAREMLTTTQENLLTITYDSGFADIRTLNAAFIRRYGVSPKDYRKGKVSSLTTNHFFSSPSVADRQTLYDDTSNIEYIEKELSTLS